jgi:2-polyprenyl-6-methoxyphenol hydroxylase-like FAD-dependent oxidoreductase
VRADFVSKERNRSQPSVEGDLLVAADGIHSVVRQHH